MCEQGNITTINLKSKSIDVDSCIAPIVIALNNAGIFTVASCCGHGKLSGNIALADGRELILCSNYETSRKIEKIAEIEIAGEKMLKLKANPKTAKTEECKRAAAHYLQLRILYKSWL